MTEEIWNLTTTQLGRQVHVYGRLDSTNTLALSFADEPSKHGLAILAREQTAGRGQYGRSWQAPPGSSVLLTVLVFPPAAMSRPAVLTAWAAVAVCEVVRALTPPLRRGEGGVRIKWPNDVLVQGKKICGILIEQRATSSGQVAAAVGIGLNVHQPRQWFDNAGLTEATSLACLGAAPESEQVARRLIERLDAEYAPEGQLESLEARWAEYLGLANREVSAEFHDGGVSQGQLLDLSFDGVVLRIDGEARIFPPETIRHLTSPRPQGEGPGRRG